MKRLFVVEVKAELVVVAETHAEAERYAQRLNHFDLPELDCTASVLTYLPCGWERDAIPFGYESPDDPDRTLQGWIDAGAAPEHAEMAARLRAAKEKCTP